MSELGDALERHTRAALNLASALNAYERAGQVVDLPAPVALALQVYREATEAVEASA